MNFPRDFSGDKIINIANGVADTDVTTVGQVNTALALKANLISPVFTTPNIGSATGSISGNAGTATALQNARTINGTSFDGSGNITITAAAGTLTGTTLNPTVVTSSLTAVGTLVNLTVTNAIAGSITGNAATVTTNANLTGDITSVGNATTIGSGKVTKPMLAASSAATPATTGAMTVPMTSSVITITPTGACTFNGSGGTAGQTVTFYITTSGASSFVLTFGTNFKSAGTLATGTVTAKTFCVSFICKDGTTWAEISRTIAM